MAVWLFQMDQNTGIKITAHGVDEVFLKINGRVHYFWRAVAQDGDGLDILVQSQRDKGAAKKFFRKLLKGLRYVV